MKMIKSPLIQMSLVIPHQVLKKIEALLATIHSNDLLTNQLIRALKIWLRSYKKKTICLSSHKNMLFKTMC